MPPRPTLSPETAEVLAEVIYPLGVQLATRALDADELAALVVGRDGHADLPPSLALHETAGGHRCAIVPLATAAAVCERSARGLAPTLRQPVRPGEVWCLLFWRDAAGDRRALTAPIRLEALARGPRGQA